MWIFTYILFNENEIKYLIGICNATKIDSSFYINARLIRKLSTDEYLAGQDQICSTIQSAAKYSIKSIDKPIEWFTDLINLSTIKLPNTGISRLFVIGNNQWMTYIPESNVFKIAYRDWIYLKETYNFMLDEIEVFFNLFLYKKYEIDNITVIPDSFL